MNSGLPTPPSFQGVIARAVTLGVVASVAALVHSWDSEVSVRDIAPVEPIIIEVPVPGPAPAPVHSPEASQEPGELPPVAGVPGSTTEPEATPMPVAAPDQPWYYINTAEALAFFETGEAIFVDARLRREFVAGHIEGAYFLPASEFNARAGEVFLNQVGPAQLVIIYCGGGECDASQNTANRIAAAGWTNYRIYHDGYDAWTTAGGLTNDGPDLYGAITE